MRLGVGSSPSSSPGTAGSSGVGGTPGGSTTGGTGKGRGIIGGNKAQPSDVLAEVDALMAEVGGP